MTEPDVLLRNMLRTRLTDPNSSRVASTPYVVDDFPWQTSLTANHFPRISVLGQFDSDRPFGFGGITEISSSRIQIDIWVKPDQPLTVGKTYQGEGFKQVRLIKRSIVTAIKDYTTQDLVATGDILYFNVVNWYPPHFDYDFNLVRQTGDVTYAIYIP